MKIVGERLIRSSRISSDHILGRVQREVARKRGIAIIPDGLPSRSDTGSRPKSRGEKSVSQRTGVRLEH